MRRIQMLHQDKSHAGISRQMLEKLRERRQTARRSTDAHNRKLLRIGWRCFS